MIWVIVIVVIVVLILGFFVLLYNGLVSLRNRVENAWAQIDVQLKRRYDLIPNLVETVKGYASHERETLDAVIQARNSAMSASGPADQAANENMLSGTLKSLFALSEAYPDLKANQNFLELQEELTSTESRIAFARQHYNDSVLSYNTKIQSVPSNIVAGMFNFTEREYFEVEGDARGPVRVDIVRTTNVAHLAVAVVIAVVLTLIVWPLGLGVWAVAVGVIVGAGVAALAFLRGDRMALSALGAEALEPGRYPQLDNIVEGLVVSNGFRMPTLYVVDDAAPNAFVVGRTARHGALAVTTGLVESLRRIELEGVLAHELSRIRSGETRAGVTAATLICRPLGFAGGLAESLAARLVDPAAGVRSDLAGVALTRYPPGLAAALAKLDADGRTVARDPRAYRHLWIDPPDDAIVGAQFSISDRVEVLTEL